MASSTLSKRKNRKSTSPKLSNNGPANRMSEAGAEWKEEFGRMVETGKDAVTGIQSDAQKGIREAPLQAVLIAVGVGAVIGLVLGRYTR